MNPPPPPFQETLIKYIRVSFLTIPNKSPFPNGIQPNSAVHGQHTAQMAEKPAAFTAMSQTRPQSSYDDTVYLTGPYNRITGQPPSTQSHQNQVCFPWGCWGIYCEQSLEYHLAGDYLIPVCQ